MLKEFLLADAPNAPDGAPSHPAAPPTASTRHRPSTDLGIDLVGYTFTDRALGQCKVVGPSTYTDEDNITWKVGALVLWIGVCFVHSFLLVLDKRGCLFLTRICVGLCMCCKTLARALTFFFLTSCGLTRTGPSTARSETSCSVASSEGPYTQEEPYDTREDCKDITSSR